MERADLAHLLALPGGFGLLARLFERNLAGLDGMRGVGFALCRVIRDEGELLSIGVGPVYRRRAIGSALLRESIERCRRAGAATIFSRSRPTTVGADALPLVRLRPVGEREGYFSGRTVPDQRLYHALRPVAASQRRIGPRLALSPRPASPGPLRTSSR